MKLITKEIDKLLSKQGELFQEDIKKGTNTAMKAVCHIFHPFSSWETYLIAYSMKDNKDYIFALTKGDFVEFGDIYLPEIEQIRLHGLSMEREIYFEPVDAQELYKKLKEKE